MLITYNLEMPQAIKVEHKVIASSGGSNTPIQGRSQDFLHGGPIFNHDDYHRCMDSLYI